MPRTNATGNIYRKFGILDELKFHQQSTIASEIVNLISESSALGNRNINRTLRNTNPVKWHFTSGPGNVLVLKGSGNGSAALR